MKINKNFEIRKFKSSDLPSVRKIIHSNFEKPWSDNMILSENLFSYKTVAVADNRIIGFFSGEIIYDEGFILIITVDKSFHGKGVGTALMLDFLKEAKDRKVSSVYLEVSRSNNRALEFYKKVGFSIYGIRERYYRNGEDAVLMKLDLY